MYSGTECGTVHPEVDALSRTSDTYRPTHFLRPFAAVGNRAEKFVQPDDDASVACCACHGRKSEECVVNCLSACTGTCR